jgi:3-dehydroquinate dehydratase/shikimate dehydrogenase
VTETPTLATERLRLRPWTDADMVPFAAINSDPRVMEFLGPVMGRTASDEVAARIRGEFAELGFGLWAAEIPGVAPFIGFIGLTSVKWAPLAPAVEIGWRLAYGYWGKGLASEGAREAMRFAFETLALDELIAFATVANRRSRQVMERIGMNHDSARDFEHPQLEPDDPLRPHVIYCRSRADWLAANG